MNKITNFRIFNQVIVGVFMLFLVGSMYSPFYSPPFRPIRYNPPYIQPPTSITNRTFRFMPIEPLLNRIQNSAKMNLVIPPPAPVPRINIYYVGPRYDPYRDLINYP